MQSAGSRCFQRSRDGTETQKQGWRFSFRRAKVASPSRQRGRLRQRVCGSHELLVNYGEYAA
jgi:hypothetical protein